MREFRQLADTSKRYECYFCEEEVAYTFAPEEIRKQLISQAPAWRHTTTGMVACGTNATPSNMEIPSDSL